MNDGDARTLLNRLVEIGRGRHFNELDEMQEFRRVLSLGDFVDTKLDVIREFGKALSQQDVTGLLMSLIVLEARLAGIGLGSVSPVFDLYPLIHDPDRAVLSWILTNTNNHWFSHGAKTLQEYDDIMRRAAMRRAKGVRKDFERQQIDRQRIAETATRRIFNAVRRGDLKAVAALIAHGADVHAVNTEGKSPLAIALDRGNSQMVTLLQARKED